MPSFTRSLALAAVALLLLVQGRLLAAQDHPKLVRLAATSSPTLRSWDAQVSARVRSGELVLVRSRADLAVPGGTLERLRQYHQGVRIFGADVTREIAGGVVVAMFGTMYDAIEVDTTPSLTVAEAVAVMEHAAGGEPDPMVPAELVILPMPDGDYRLTYRGRIRTLTALPVYFVDAHTGEVALVYDDLKTQSAVGRARGLLGDLKKISTEQRAGTFVAVDRLRPGGGPNSEFGGITTFDMKGGLARINSIITGTLSGEPDLARDSDNDWGAGEVVDAQVYAGWVTDYLFKRFARDGLDGRHIEIWNFVNPVLLENYASSPPQIRSLFYTNAAYVGNGNIFYGVGLPGNVTRGGQTWRNLAGGLDVVAHELVHGVTEFTSDLIYMNESGALNEAYSDVVATAVEFFFQQPGTGPLRADYLVGEDVIDPGGLRSLADPRSYGLPDHYSRRFTGPEDAGGVHINSSIAGHAYYLAVEGGTNRTSGLTVQGIGRTNVEQMERIFFRAFTQLMPANANFATARVVTIQAARDLYGAGSTPERALIQAWSAVGVN